MRKPYKAMVAAPEPPERAPDADAIIARLMEEASWSYVEDRRQERRWWIRINNAMSAAYTDGIEPEAWEAEARRRLGLPPPRPETAPA